MNGGEVLARVLAASGVREVYGVPAGKLGTFHAALAEDDRFRYLGVRHESAATWMAAATFQATGRIAVAFGESGPGSLNLVGGLGGAANNGTPLLVLTPGAPTHVAYPFRGLLMELDNRALFAPLVKWGATIRDPLRIPELVRRALREALGGRPGPVHLELPVDVLRAEVELDDALLDAPLSAYRAAPPAGDAAAVASAAQLLAGARRPLLIAGGGVPLAGAERDFRALTSRLGALATATQMGLGTVATDDPRFIGHGGFLGGDAVIRACAEADVVLAVGTKLGSWLWRESTPLVGSRPGQALIQVDIDGSAIGRSAPVDIGIEGDAGSVLAQLLAALGRGHGRVAVDEAWIDDVVAAYAAHRAHLDALADTDDGGPMHPAALARELGRHLPTDALAAFDGGHTTFWSNDFTPVAGPRTHFHEPGMTHLGFGLPYANALKALYPERTVVHITGDGAFGFTVQELDTARRYGLAAVHVIHDNAQWGVIRLGQSKAGFEHGTALEGTDYAAIARGFGCHGETITRVEEVGPALRRALASGLPAVIDAKVRFAPHPLMPWFAGADRRPG